MRLNVHQVLCNQGAVLIPLNSILLARHRAPALPDGTELKDRVVAVRLPCMSTSHFKDFNEASVANGHLPEASLYAFLVLVLPNDPHRKWQGHEFDMVTAVADQVLSLALISNCNSLSQGTLFCAFFYSLPSHFFESDCAIRLQLHSPMQLC